MNVGEKADLCFLPLIAALVGVSQENKGGVAVYLDPCFSVMLLLFFVWIVLMNIAEVCGIIKKIVCNSVLINGC